MYPETVKWPAVLWVCTSLVAFGQNFDLLEEREWKSSDGRALRAELLEIKGHDVRFKRSGDSREFSVPIGKLSDADRNLLAEAKGEIVKMVREADESARTGLQFRGLPNPGEKVWELARRLGEERTLWNAATQAAWGSWTRSDRLVRINPKSFKRITATECLIVGEWIALKVRCESSSKLNIVGERLMAVSSDEKVMIAERGSEYLPKVSQDGLVSLTQEKIGVSEMLVMTLDLDQR